MSKNKLFKKVNKIIEDRDIKFVCILWCDNANIIRAKAVHSQIL
jgi:glutamine synthetase